MTRINETRPSTFHIWFTAARPHTLTASLCPSVVAAALLRPTNWKLQALWLAFCVTVQLGTNLHNDYADFVQGADTEHRVGQPRATAQGWLTPAQTCMAACVCLTATTLCGILLALEAERMDDGVIWFLILSSVFNAFAYTAGPFPLGYIGLGNWSIAYSGWGDIFCFLYFGLVAVLMVPYLLRQLAVSHFLYATQVGLLSTNILVVNNLRDRYTDVHANKKTTTVRFGKTFSMCQYIGGQALSFALSVAMAFYFKNGLLLLPFLCLPMAIRETKAILCKEGADLNKHVGGAAKVQVAFSSLLATALYFSL